MQRIGIRDARPIVAKNVPDSTSFHPGYTASTREASMNVVVRVEVEGVDLDHFQAAVARFVEMVEFLL
jgi:hypothetical protein